MLRLALLALCLAGCSVAAPPRALPPHPHVYLVVIDGFDPRHATAEKMSALFGASGRDERRTGRSQPSMPTVTNANHTTLGTGVEPDAHGVTGNAYWERGTADDRAKLDNPALIEVQTAFTVAESAAPALRTLGIFGKPKLGRLFSAVSGRQRQADVLWDPESANAPRDGRTGYATDPVVTDALLAAMGDQEPDYTFVNLPGVDFTSHQTGPNSPATAQAVRDADTSVGRLLQALRDKGWWNHAIVLVTGDHGFDDVAPSAAVPAPAVALGPALAERGVRGVHVVPDGGVAHLYADVDADTGALTEAARAARTVPGVAAVYARIAVPGVEPLPADWHLAHPRAGDLLVVAAPGHQLVRNLDGDDAKLRGNHGSPRERSVPLVVTGGHPIVRALPPTLTVRHADIGATVLHWLGLPATRRLDAGPLPAGSAGTPFSTAN